MTLPSPAAMSSGLFVLDQRGFSVFEPELNNDTDFNGITATFGTNGLRHMPCQKQVERGLENRRQDA